MSRVYPKPTSGGGTTDLTVVLSNLATIMANTQLRIITSEEQIVGIGETWALQIDSLTRGADIEGILIEGTQGEDATVDIYVPVTDGVTVPTAPLVVEESYISTDTIGGYIRGPSIKYNCFVSITNNGAIAFTVSQVVVFYKSSGEVTLAWGLVGA